MNLITGEETAKIIKKHRLAREMTQKDLSRQLGITQTVISCVERRTVGVPANRLPMIAKILKIDTEILRRAAMKDFRKELSQHI